RGRTEAIEAAAALGFRVQIDPGKPPSSEAASEGVLVRQGDDGETQVTVPLPTSTAYVRFGTTRLSPVAAVYFLLAIAAVMLAGLLGTRIGVAFDADVALATREVRRAGVAEVMRGTIILHEARFGRVHDLLAAVDRLGGVFREFAGA